MQSQHGVVQLDMRRQNFLEICLGHIECGGFAMCVGIVRAPVAVEDGDVAKPNARLDIGEGDQFARYGGRADTDRPFGAGDPLLRRFSAGCNEFAVFVPFDVSASKYVVPE